MFNIVLFPRQKVRKCIEQEGYAERWNANDLVARGGITIDEYIASIRNPTLSEMCSLSMRISEIQDEPNWLRSIPWKVLMFGAGEGGLPHTHGPYIMLPIGVKFSASTLKHEKVHVYQRLYPLETCFALVNANPITGFEYPESNQRANPDTSRILFGNMRPVWKDDVRDLRDIEDTRDHPFELMAYEV